MYLTVIMARSPEYFDLKATEIALEKYYLHSNTVGCGEFVQGTIFSKGRGFGSLIRAAIRAATPIAKRVAKTLKPMAKKTAAYAVKKGVETGIGSLIDVTQGIAPGEAIRRNAAKTMEDIQYDIHQKAQSVKRKLTSKAAPKKKKKLRKASFA